MDSYDVTNISNKQALADVIIMLCIYSAEIKNLRISNIIIIGYAKNWGQQDIPQVFRSLEKDKEQAKQLLTWIQNAISSGQLKDPEKPGTLWFNTFLKKDEFLSKIGKLLLPSFLCNLESVFAVATYCAKNLSKASTISDKTLRHSLDNHASSSKRYTIVNMQKRKELYNQTNAFKLFDKNWLQRRSG